MKVLIAGAGPVGLSAANLLAGAGIPVAVFEAAARLPDTLRASTFQPPTLDMLARFGVTQDLMAMGNVAPRVQYRNRHGWVAEFDLAMLANETQHPFRLQCEQFRLNRLLAARLAAYPHASLEYASEVMALEQDDASVTLALSGGRRITGDWLIGADGGRSAVRKSLDIAFEGFTWPERFLVASTPFDFKSVIPGLCDVSYFADPEEWFFLLRVRDVWRVMFPTRSEEDEEEILSDAGIQRRLQRIHPANYEVVHRTVYPVHQRVAAAYRKGRAFLAGDAAHLNNPLGGMGMNGGIHDGFSIAEKIVQVVQGKQPGDFLDIYERQRRPVALDYVNNISTANKRNLESRDPGEQRRWREEMTNAAADPARARDYLLKISMIASLRKAERAV